MALPRRSSENANKKGKEFDPIPNLPLGEHEARLVYVADLGIQEGREHKGEKKPDVQQISLGFEVVGQTVEIDGEEKPRYLWLNPFNIYHKLTEKGKELEYYSIFDPSASEGEVADWDAQLGKPCSIRISHNNGKGKNEGKVFDNISGILAIPEKYQAGVAPATLEVGVGDADDEDNPVNAALFGLTKWVFDRRIDAAPKKEAPKKNDAIPDDDFDDDIPF
jgi:hypothetical protein